MSDVMEHISRNPKFRELERRRSSFAWTLTAIMLAVGVVCAVAAVRLFERRDLAGT